VAALRRYIDGVSAHAACDAAMRAALALDASSRVLLFGTEGASDPAPYAALIGQTSV